MSFLFRLKGVGYAFRLTLGIRTQLLIIGFQTVVDIAREGKKKEAFVLDCHHLIDGRIARDIDLLRQTQDWEFEAFACFACFIRALHSLKISAASKDVFVLNSGIIVILPGKLVRRLMVVKLSFLGKRES